MLDKLLQSDVTLALDRFGARRSPSSALGFGAFSTGCSLVHGVPWCCPSSARWLRRSASSFPIISLGRSGPSRACFFVFAFCVYACFLCYSLVLYGSPACVRACWSAYRPAFSDTWSNSCSSRSVIWMLGCSGALLRSPLALGSPAAAR
jgi:hypothetical protein